MQTLSDRLTESFPVSQNLASTRAALVDTRGSYTSDAFGAILVMKKSCIPGIDFRIYNLFLADAFVAYVDRESNGRLT